jgi:hypothetical protein
MAPPYCRHTCTPAQAAAGEYVDALGPAYTLANPTATWTKLGRKQQANPDIWQQWSTSWGYPRATGTKGTIILFEAEAAYRIARLLACSQHLRGLTACPSVYFPVPNTTFCGVTKGKVSSRVHVLTMNYAHQPCKIITVAQY